MNVIRQVTSYGYIWIDSASKRQIAVQVGHHMNGEAPTTTDMRRLRKLTSSKRSSFLK